MGWMNSHRWLRIVVRLLDSLRSADGSTKGMLTGRRYELRTSARAIETLNGKLISITVAAGKIVEVVSIPTDVSDTMIDVLMEGRTATMFAVDARVHATEITDQNVTA